MNQPELKLASDDGQPPTRWNLFRWQAEVMDRGLLARISSSAGKVLWVLARHANQNGRCWPSRATLMKQAGVCMRTLRGILCELEDAGLVSRRKRGGSSSVYTLMTDLNPGLFSSLDRPPDGPEMGATFAPTTGQLLPRRSGQVLPPRTIQELSKELFSEKKRVSTGQTTRRIVVGSMSDKVRAGVERLKGAKHDRGRVGPGGDADGRTVADAGGADDRGAGGGVA